MRVQTVDNSVNMQGLYFTKVPNVIFNKNQQVTYLNPKDTVKISDNGFRYIEDRTISKNLKEKFMAIPLLKNLSEKFDMFVFFKEVPKRHPDNVFADSNFSFTRIMWADMSKDCAEHRVVCGTSQISQEIATDKMLNNLKKENFNEIG